MLTSVGCILCQTISRAAIMIDECANLVASTAMMLEAAALPHSRPAGMRKTA
jgi:hypothetical protein